MAGILKIFALISSILTSGYLLMESLRRGLIVFSTVIGILKFIVILTFAGLLVFVLYLLLSKERFPSDQTY